MVLQTKWLPHVNVLISANPPDTNCDSSRRFLCLKQKRKLRQPKLKTNFKSKSITSHCKARQSSSFTDWQLASVGLAGSETRSAKHNKNPGSVYGHNERSGEPAAARSRGSLRLIEQIHSNHPQQLHKRALGHWAETKHWKRTCLKGEHSWISLKV